MLRGLARLAAVAILAGTVGLLLGLGLSKLSSTGSQTSAGAAQPAAPGQAAGAGQSAPASPRPRRSGRAALAHVRVKVLSALLQPAATPAGRARRRARLDVQITAANRGKLVVTPQRSVLVVGGTSVKTDPRADAGGTRLGPLAAGQTAAVTLRFELAGAVTTQLRRDRSAQVIVAGHSLSVAVTLGPPVGANTVR